MRTINIMSEINPLRTVMIRRPGNELTLLTPEKMETWLFDDVVHVPFIQQEHDVFVDCLKAMNVETIQFDTLLQEVMANKNSSIKRLFDSIISSNELNGLIKNYDIDTIYKYLIMGIPPTKNLPVLTPLLNLIFTRDIGAIVGNSFLPATASKLVRRREMSVAQTVLKSHPEFKNINELNYIQNYSLEGGDIQVLSKDIVVIGVSERTSRQAVESVIPSIHQQGFNYIVIVNLNEKRSCMHLDTIFTQINHDECLVFSPMITEKNNSQFCDAEIFTKTKDHVKIGDGLLAALNEIGLKLTPIKCGGDDEIYQQREQWTDGANALTVRPGHIFNYRRNEHTINELKKHGYSHVYAEDIKTPLPEDKKFIITFLGQELSRGRGGPHCLTFPIYRE